MALTIRRLNNKPDKNGITPTFKATGIHTLQHIMNKLRDTIAKEEPPFQEGTLVRFALANRKERPNFCKLARVWQEGKVEKVVSEKLRQVSDAQNKRFIIATKNLRSRMTDCMQHDATNNTNEQTPAHTDDVTPNHQQVDVMPDANSDTDELMAVNEQSISVAEEAASTPYIVGDLIVFERDDQRFAGEILSINKSMHKIQLYGISAPQSPKYSWERAWIERELIRKTVHLSVRSTPRVGNEFLTVSPFTHDVHASKITSRLTLNERRQIDGVQPEDARTFLERTAELHVFVAEETGTDTTHQKVRFAKLNSSEKEKAIAAFNKEMDKYDKYGVKQTVSTKDLPHDATVVRPVVIFTNKLTTTGERIYKCRVTGDGSNVVMDDTSTSNANMEEVRVLLTLAACNKHFKGDVVTADAEQGYFQAEARQNNIFMTPPSIHSDARKGLLWKINKNLYGLPDGGAVFEEKVHNVLRATGWEQIVGLNHSWKKLNSKREVEGLLAVYVDDMLCIGLRTAAVRLLQEINTKLVINIQEGNVRFVGNDFTFSGVDPSHNQTKYIQSLQTDSPKTGLERKFHTPLPTRINEKEDKSQRLDEKGVRKARKTLGELLFVSRDSRPDLAYAASFIGKSIAKATKLTRHLLDRAVAYAKETPVSIAIPRSYEGDTVELEAFVDASLGNDNAVHGQTGWIITANGRPLMWRSKTQSRVARSSPKAELIALHDATDVLEWLRNVIKGVGGKSTAVIHSDAKDVIQVIGSKYGK